MSDVDTPLRRAIRAMRCLVLSSSLKLIGSAIEQYVTVIQFVIQALNPEAHHARRDPDFAYRVGARREAFRHVGTYL